MSTIFPKWTNSLPTFLAVNAVGAFATAVGVVWYYFTPSFWEVGYMPTQPGQGFSHAIHAGKLGMDCRYCHTHVEESSEANIPNVATCIGCHAENRLAAWDVHRVENIRQAYAEDRSVAWRRVHKLPDYVRNFPHNVHVQAGVSCYSCHGNIARMPVVHQVESLSMSWCLDCHRNPEPNLVPKDMVTRLFDVEQFLADGEGRAGVQARLLEAQSARPFWHPPERCGSCHY